MESPFMSRTDIKACFYRDNCTPILIKFSPNTGPMQCPEILSHEVRIKSELDIFAHGSEFFQSCVTSSKV